jgi:diadenosine tetraphosphate (Ap4A) HIT family hydrolase
MAYIKGEGKSGHETASAGQCPFCRIIAMDDAEGLVIARGGTVYAVLNLYPYNPGHLMVVPYRHVADYPDLSAEETTELATFTQRAMLAARRAAAPHGFNIGINQGAIGGAGQMGRRCQLHAGHRKDQGAAAAALGDPYAAGGRVERAVLNVTQVLQRRGVSPTGDPHPAPR